MNRKANGAAIGSLRKALGVRQIALAASAGISAQFLSQIEHGVRQPSPPVLRLIADELGVTLEAVSYPAPAAEVLA